MVLLLYGASAVAAVMSLLASVSHNGFKGMIIVVFCGAAWIGVQHLGYVEFGMAGRMFVNSTFRRHLNGHITLQTLEETRSRHMIRKSSGSRYAKLVVDLDSRGVNLHVNGGFQTKTLTETYGDNCWNIEIPLADRSFLLLSRQFDNGPCPTIVVALAEILHKNFQGRSVWANPSVREPLCVPSMSVRQLPSGRHAVRAQAAGLSDAQPMASSIELQTEKGA